MAGLVERSKLRILEYWKPVLNLISTNSQLPSNHFALSPWHSKELPSEKATEKLKDGSDRLSEFLFWLLDLFFESCNNHHWYSRKILKCPFPSKVSLEKNDTKLKISIKNLKYSKIIKNITFNFERRILGHLVALL